MTKTLKDYKPLFGANVKNLELWSVLHNKAIKFYLKPRYQDRIKKEKFIPGEQIQEGFIPFAQTLTERIR